MKLKNISKLALGLAAGAALVATLINDNKEKSENEVKVEDEKEIVEEEK
ncbi:hypothetical protein [Clostridium sartagoforme]|jgi:hypothetical protein|nr:hypothetical protein [Clostridium sartagoforme]